MSGNFFAIFAGIDEEGYVKPSESNGELKISIVNVLKIPTIWFSFMAFIVATVCNGFLSINLEPKVNVAWDDDDEWKQLH